MSIFHEASTPLNSKVVASSSGILLTNVPCDPTVYVGAAVRMDSLGTAYNAQANVEANSNVIGIVQAKSSSTLCDIRVTGATPAIFLSLDPTKEYFLSETVAGGLTITPPTGSGQIVLRIGQPLSATRLVVNKGTGFKRA